MEEQSQELDGYQKKILEHKEKGFDLRTHIKDPRTGKVIKEQPYRLVVSREKGTFFIRDGIHYSEQGIEIGREAGFEKKEIKKNESISHK